MHQMYTALTDHCCTFIELRAQFRAFFFFFLQYYLIVWHRRRYISQRYEHAQIFCSLYPWKWLNSCVRVLGEYFLGMCWLCFFVYQVYCMSYRRISGSFRLHTKETFINIHCQFYISLVSHLWQKTYRYTYWMHLSEKMLLSKREDE